MVRFEAKVTDGADHTETVSKTVPVSNRPIQISLLPEGGRLIPGLENRVFVAAIYPDGKPASVDVVLWQGNRPQLSDEGWLGGLFGHKPLGASAPRIPASPRSSSRLSLTGFRATEWKERPVEMLGGTIVQNSAPTNVFDACAVAQDSTGDIAVAPLILTSEPLGENLLLRLDKAIYRAGSTLKAEILTNAGGKTVYFDVVRSGQTLLTRWLDTKDCRAATTPDR